MDKIAILLFFYFIHAVKVGAQKSNDTFLFGPKISRIYNVYEINDIYFSYDSFGKGLIIKPNHLRKGKQYFKYYTIPLLFKMDVYRADKRSHKGMIIKKGQGKPFNKIDTTIYTGIELKYPLEIDGKLMEKNTINNKDTQPIIINGFQFVKNCAKYPYKHFEINTKK